MDDYIGKNKYQPTTVVEFFCYILIFSFVVFGNALTFNLGSRLPIKLSEVILIFTAVPLILKQCVLPAFNNRRFSEKPINLLFAWGVLSLFLFVLTIVRYDVPLSGAVSSALYLVRFIFTVFVAYLAAVYVKSIGREIRFIKFIIFCYVLVGAIGVFQLVFFPVAYDWYDIFWKLGVYFPEADPHIGRLISTYFDPNYLASCLIIPISLLIYLVDSQHLYLTGKTRKRAIFIIALIAYFLFIILLTNSRSGILGIGVLVFFYIFFLGTKNGKVNLKVYVILFAFCFIALGFVLFSNISVFERIRYVFVDPSAMARLKSWGKGFTVLVETDFLGIGYNMFGEYLLLKTDSITAASGYGLDSSLLLSLVTTGIIGFLIFVAHFFNYVADRKTNKIFKSMILAALIICNFNNLLFYALWIMPFYFIITLTRKENKL